MSQYQTHGCFAGYLRLQSELTINNRARTLLEIKNSKISAFFFNKKHQLQTPIKISPTSLTLPIQNLHFSTGSFNACEELTDSCDIGHGFNQNINQNGCAEEALAVAPNDKEVCLENENEEDCMGDGEVETTLRDCEVEK